MRDTHYFIAIALSPEYKSRIAEMLSQMKIEDLFAKWVHKEDYHITLAFLGKADRQKLETCMNELAEVLEADAESFTYNLNGFGIFGNPESPRVFYLSPEREAVLLQIRKKTADICRKHGFTVEDRPFHPHITLARKYSGSERFHTEKLQYLNEEANDPAMKIRADTVCLYETQIGKIPKYKAIRSIRLKD